MGTLTYNYTLNTWRIPELRALLRSNNPLDVCHFDVWCECVLIVHLYLLVDPRAMSRFEKRVMCNLSKKQIMVLPNGNIQYGGSFALTITFHFFSASFALIYTILYPS